MKRLLRLQLGDRPLKSRELFAALSGGPPADPPAAPSGAPSAAPSAADPNESSR